MRKLWLSQTHLLCQETCLVELKIGVQDLLETAWERPFGERRVLVLPAAVYQLEELRELRQQATSETRGVTRHAMVNAYMFLDLSVRALLAEVQLVAPVREPLNHLL